MTEEILKRSLDIYNKIVELKNVLKNIVDIDGQINRFKRIEVRVVGSESSTTLNESNSDKVISILCREIERLEEQFEKIKA